MKSLLLFCCLFLAGLVAQAQFTTPNTGVKYNLNSLVTASAAKGSVTFSGGIYFVNDSITIAPTDTLHITTNETLKLGDKIMLNIAGTLIINPPDSVKITAINPANVFHSLRFENANRGSVLRKTIVEYGNGIRIVSARVRIDSCIVRFNARTYSSGAISLSGSPRTRITNCKIYRNTRSAILSPANIATSPIIRNNWIFENSTENGNWPQINLGPGGNDTTIITGNTIIGINNAANNAGGISVSNLLATGNSNFFIQQNTIKNNRYGIGVIGNNLKGYIKQNILEGNNVNPNVMTGGSGINFNSTTGTQQVVVARNIIRNNSWGITIQSGTGVGIGPKPMLGKIGSADTANVGLNQIYNNFNVGTSGQIWDIYNNTTDSIYAENNLWGTTSLADIESHIFHKADNAAHGFVDFMPIFQPAVSGIPAEGHDKIVAVYPNPASELVKISLNGMVSNGKSNLRFYNNLGQEVLNMQPAENTGTVEINTAYLPAGLYVYRLENDAKTYTGKLLIAK